MDSQQVPWPPMARPSEPRFIPLSDVPPGEDTFFWRPYIPDGRVTLLEGPESMGKSTLLGEFAAARSKGLSPGPTPTPYGEPANVLILSAEEIDRDIVARIGRMGGDPKRVYVLDKNSPALWLDTTGLGILARYMQQLHAGLVAIDPLISFTPNGITHGATIRRITRALNEMAQLANCPIILTRHWTKVGKSTRLRGVGSTELSAEARSRLVTVWNPPDGQENVLCHEKSSTTQPGTSLVFVPHGTIGWQGPSPLTADEALEAMVGLGRMFGNALREAKEFLLQELETGPQVSEELIKRARKQAQISERTLARAKTALGCQTKRYGIPGKQGGGVWLMALAGYQWPDELPPHLLGDLPGRGNG